MTFDRADLNLTSTLCNLSNIVDLAVHNICTNSACAIKKQQQDQYLCSHLCLFTHGEAVPLQNLHNSKFHQHHSKSHPNAVPGPYPKRHVRVWVNGLLVLLAEPESTHIQTHNITSSFCGRLAKVNTKRKNISLPLRFEFLRFRPDIWVPVQGPCGDHDNHAFRNHKAIYLHRRLGYTLQTGSNGIQPKRFVDDTV